MGLTFDTVRFTVRPTKDRIASMAELILSLRSAQSTNNRTLLSLLGKMESVVTLLPIARVYKRPFQRELLARVLPYKGFNQVVLLEECIHPTTAKWLDSTWIISSVPILPLGRIVYLFTDAFLHGWGGCTDTLTVSGTWTPAE